MSRPKKLVLAAIGLVVLLAVVGLLFQQFVLPLLPDEWQDPLVSVFLTVLTVISLFSGVFKISGYTLRDFIGSEGPAGGREGLREEMDHGVAGVAGAREAVGKRPASNTDTQQRMLEVVDEMKSITGSYVEALQRALAPHTPEKFTRTKDRVTPGRGVIPEWWERVIRDGAFKGNPVLFLEDHQTLLNAYERLAAIVQLIPEGPVWMQAKCIVTLVQQNSNTFRLDAGYQRAEDKANYRKAHLRKHIKAVLDLDAELAKFGTATNEMS